MGKGGSGRNQNSRDTMWCPERGGAAAVVEEVIDGRVGAGGWSASRSAGGTPVQRLGSFKQRSGDRGERDREPSLAVCDPIAIAAVVQQASQALLELVSGRKGSIRSCGSRSIAPSDAAELSGPLDGRRQSPDVEHPAQRHEAKQGCPGQRSRAWVEGQARSAAATVDRPSCVNAPLESVTRQRGVACKRHPRDDGPAPSQGGTVRRRFVSAEARSTGRRRVGR